MNSYCLRAASGEVGYLVVDRLVFLFLLLVSLFELLVAVVVFIRVVRGGGIFGDEPVHQRYGSFHPRSDLSLAVFEFCRVVDGVVE